VSGSGGDELFFSGQFEEARASGLEGHGTHQVFEEDFLFGAEAATDSGFDNPDLLHGQLQALGYYSADMKRNLGAGSDDETPSGVYPGEGDVGFHGAVLGLVGGELSFDDEFCFSEALFHVTEGGLASCGEVGCGVIRNGDYDVSFGFVVDDWGAPFHGVSWVEDSGQEFVFDVNEGQGLGSDAFVVGGHGRHSVADEADLIIQGEGVIRRGFREALAGGGMWDPGQVFPCKHGPDALEGRGRFGIDADDSCMGVRRPEDLHHEGALRQVICYVLFGAAG
jgi:hypothetical protein